MSSGSTTYRFWAVFTACIVMAATVIPTGAKGKSMSMNRMHQDKNPNSDLSCCSGLGEGVSSSMAIVTQSVLQSPASSCNVTFKYICCKRKTPTEVETAPVISIFRMGLSLTGMVLLSWNTSIKKRPYYPAETSLTEASPPIFLKNSSFLN